MYSLSPNPFETITDSVSTVIPESQPDFLSIFGNADVFLATLAQTKWKNQQEYSQNWRSEQMSD